MLTVQDRCTWCCWVMMMANGVRALPTSSRAWVSDTSVLRKIRSTTIPRSRTLRPTVSAYSLQLFPNQGQTGGDKRAQMHTGAIWNETFQERFDIRHFADLNDLIRGESRHTFGLCSQRSQSSQPDGRCRSAVGVLHSTVGTIHYAAALLVEYGHLTSR